MIRKGEGFSRLSIVGCYILLWASDKNNLFEKMGKSNGN